MTDFNFLERKRKKHIKITPVTEKDFLSLKKKLPAAHQAQIDQAGFTAKKETGCFLYDTGGHLEAIIAGYEKPMSVYDFAFIPGKIAAGFGEDFIKKTSFEIGAPKLKDDLITKIFIGWGLAGYKYTAYQKPPKEQPKLLWHTAANKPRVTSMLEAIFMLRDLVNTPANDLGPEELEKAAAKLAKTHKAKFSVIKDQKLLAEEFPLIHTVGKGAEDKRLPRLIDFTWGNAKNTKITLVGKGVCFDTGGLDIKPSQYMRLMKKDMGGAAHALGLASLIMSMNLPVRLRVLIPAVENSVSGAAFRPGDIIKSRKGLTVENTNTDAEGRLILADALTLASEDKPELIMDFATLTGSARAGLGPDIPALFSNNDALAQRIQTLSFEADDPLWSMPLHAPYNKHTESPIADLVNSAGIPGDLIFSALFLQSFLISENDKAPDWVHIDCFAWEQSGRPGRPKGGADTGLRAMFEVLEKLYS